MRSQAELQELLSGMTVEEKIGQLVELNAEFFIKSASEVTGPNTSFGLREEDLSTIGSTLNFSGAKEMREIQSEHLERDRNKIPMLFAMDVIHGYKTLYPIPLAMGCSFDPELMRECCRMAAAEASAAGVHLTFAPMLDLCREPRWGRVMETCGEDAYLNSVMGVAQVEGYQGDSLSDEGSIAASVKHLAGYGGAESGRDYNTVEISEHSLREFYLPAYKACIDAGAKLVMPSFNNLGGLPSTANPWIMRKILREEWGYDGLVVSDYAAINELMRHGVAEDLRACAVLAFENQCDVEMMSAAYYKHLASLIEEGVFTEEQLDRSVMRMLKLKNELGLFDDPYHKASEEKERELFYCEKHRETVRRADDSYERYTSGYMDCGILPLYFFGEGLSYTEFVYESMTLDRSEMRPDETLRVSVTLRNAGQRDGKEVVQLYLHDLVSSTVRPIQELVAFEKVLLKAGERRTVTFEIREDMLRLWSFEGKHISEKGEFTISVGYADHMHFTEKFRLI